jgi:uncharacterized protein YciW
MFASLDVVMKITSHPTDIIDIEGQSAQDPISLAAAESRVTGEKKDNAYYRDEGRALCTCKKKK